MTTTTAECPTCRYRHGPDDTCWFDSCGCCGGPYATGPSRSPLCRTCAEMEDEEN